MHRQIFRMVSQNPDYVKTFDYELKKPDHFACRRRMINQQFEKKVKTDYFPNDDIVLVSVNFFEKFIFE